MGARGDKHVDDLARERYRERVRRDNPLSRRVDQHGVIEDLLGRIEALDAHVAGVLRSLDPDDARAFLDVLTMMRAAQFKAVPGSGEGTDYGEWFRWLYQNAGAVAAEQRPAIDRMTVLIALPERLALLRQLDPACPPPAEQAFTSAPDPQVWAAARELIERYQEVQPRIGIGMGDAALSAELAELGAACRELRDQQTAQNESWKFLQWWCAAVTGSLARCLAIQRQAAAAAEAFTQAAAEWKLIGEAGQAADCLARAAEVTLTDGADVDEALGPILRELAAQDADAGGRAAPSVGRAVVLSRLAQIYLDAGDHFDAGARAEEAAGLLDELGFADPAGMGVPAAFRAWVEVDYAEDMGTQAATRTQAMLSAVAVTWHAIIRVRMELRPGTPGTEVQAQLAELGGELGREARRVAADLDAAAATFGLSAGAVSERTEQARDEFAIRQAEVHGLVTELSLLQEEFDRCEGEEALADLLGRIEALEVRVLAGPQGGLVMTAVTARVLRSDLLVQLGRLDEAAALLAEIRGRLATEPGLAEAERRSELVMVLGRAAMVEGMRGDFDRTSQLCGEGITEAEQDRGKASGPYLQDDYLRFRSRLYGTGVFAAKRAGDYELMLARSELVKARGVLGWAVTGAAGGRGDARADEAAFRQLTAALSRAGGTGEERARMAAERRALWDRLMTERTRSARQFAPPGFSLAALQAGLAPDEVVISYFWLSRVVLLIVTIDGSSVVAEQVNLGDGGRATVDAVVAGIGSIEGDEAPWLERDCRRLGRLLLPKEGRGLLAGKQRVIVSPHRVLHQLPFQAFEIDGVPLADRLAVSYVPNLTSMLLPPAGAGAGPVLALGVSSFGGAGLAALPNAGREAAAVAGLYEQAGVPVTLLTDGQASADRIRALHEQGALAGFGTLHLVTHGDNPPVSEPYDAGLYLSGGRIDGLEISQWQLGAGLVVLSACDTGRRAISGRGLADGTGGPDEELFGDEVLGLQAAFFAAGARQLLGALWPVADGSARTLMCAFHEELATGVPAESALRQAMAEMRATNLPMYHWAPYKLVRLGRAQGDEPST
jgi:CHAT domain